MSVPANLDYDSWLGPTPKEPYTEHRVHPHTGYGRPGWLQIDTNCRGMITGWGAHMNDTAQWANDANTVCVLAHIAMQLGRKLYWDPAAERFTGDVEADRYLDYTHRKPWTI
jgi:hypothetical protein